MQPQPRMTQTLLEEWVSVNTGTDNLDGLSTMRMMLQEAFSALNAKEEVIELPPRAFIDANGELIDKPVGPALRWTKHEKAKKRVLLVGHMDTIFPKTTTFRAASLVDINTLMGPGTADMKGGIVIMLEALKQLESSPHAENLGWEVIITSDEEVGSPSSKELLISSAKKATVGLVFEPSLPEGTLVSARKGSATLSVIAKGKAAHVGREHHLGRNAITALAHFIAAAHKLHSPDNGTIINFGHIQGGTTPNVVPDLAIAKVNIRADDNLEQTIEQFKSIAQQTEEGITIEVVTHTLRPPKPFDKGTEALFEIMRSCAEELGTTLNWQPSGGVCDGNFLAAAGLPTIDTIGAIGGSIHTTEEYVKLDSMEQRSKLVAHFLIELAAGEIEL